MCFSFLVQFYSCFSTNFLILFQILSQLNSIKTQLGREDNTRKKKTKWLNKSQVQIDQTQLKAEIYSHLEKILSCSF
jgi:hypothetical protein